MAVWENSEEEFSEAPFHVKGNHDTFDLRTSGPDVPRMFQDDQTLRFGEI